MKKKLRKVHLITEGKLDKLLAILIIFTVFLAGGGKYFENVYGENFINVENVNNSSSLTEEQLSRIKVMAQENDYIRDVDDFSSVEAYMKYLEYRGEAKKNYR